MPGVQRTRGLACKNRKHASQSPQVHRIASGLPCAMVLTGCFVLSLVIGLSCHHRRPRCQSIVAHLTSASRCQDHTTSPSAAGAFVFRATYVHRISPNVRDDGQRPSSGRDGRSCRGDLPDALSEIFLQAGLDSPNQLDPPRQISFLVQVSAKGPNFRK